MTEDDNHMDGYKESLTHTTIVMRREDANRLDDYICTSLESEISNAISDGTIISADIARFEALVPLIRCLHEAYSKEGQEYCDMSNTLRFLGKTYKSMIREDES